MRKRPIKISLRLNEQEHEHLKQQAMLSGLPNGSIPPCADLWHKPPIPTTR